MMKKVILSTSLIALLFTMACGDDEDDCGILSCIRGARTDGDLNVKVTINTENPEVEVFIFQGKIENQDTLFSDILTEKNKVYQVESDNYYSGTILYKDGIKEILVINGKNMPTIDNDCDCPRGKNINLNLRLAK
ncbi:MAG: hypothetical protein JXR03_20610 [Cyclobacteriaceae bacterium]